MPATSNGFLDNLFSGILGPKGNMADWQHARRLFIDGKLKLAPKQKFLYHVYFRLDPIVRTILPELADKHNLEIGMLVKSADLPKFTANVETKNKYNRKKNVHTSISYDPINITFHDDNYGVTTALLEAYYRYYFADASYGRIPGAYNKAGAGDNTYKGSGFNQYKYGLDNDITVPFFQSIEISQLSRKTHTTYTIVNPIITAWQHDGVDSADGNTTMQNSITVAYEAVHYSRGLVEAGSEGSPTGFGSQEHYDKQPSPISLLGGGRLGIDGLFGAGADLYDYIAGAATFKSPLEAGLAAFQFIRSVEGLTSEGLREDGFRIIGNTIGQTAGIDVSGVANSSFPKNNGNSGSNQTTPASSITGNTPVNGSSATGSGAAVSGALVAAQFSRQELLENPLALEAAAIQLYKRDYLTSGAEGGVNNYVQSWNQLPDSRKKIYKDRAIE
jgi:hypothetical protein